MSGKSRLAEALVDWMKQAEERGVYLEYRFSGAAPAPVLCEADGKLLGEIGSVVSTMLDACGRLPEAERWMSLELDRDAEGLHLSCTASGDCEVEPGEINSSGLRAVFRRDGDGTRLELETKAEGTTGKDSQGGTPLCCWKENSFQHNPLWLNKQEERTKPKEETI